MRKKMTVKECFETALSFLSETAEENPEMKKFSIAWCNVLLGETFEHENVYRIYKGKEELLHPLKVLGYEEEIPYNENLVRKAFPYGMARWMFRENDDISASHEYYSLYVNAIKEATPVLFGKIKDVYSAEGEKWD